MNESVENGFEEATSEDLSVIFEGYAASYDLLARLYRSEADAALIAELRNVRFPMNTGNDDVDKGYWLIASYLSRNGAVAESELAVDYSRTFIGGGIDSYSAAYPFESVHTGRRRLLMQAARDEVLSIYKAYGLEKSGQMKDGEDHIAYELEFMKVMAERCAQAFAAEDMTEAEALAEVQLNFLKDHLLAWVDKFTIQMRHFSKTDFYKGLSRLTQGILQEHYQLLQELLDR